MAQKVIQLPQKRRKERKEREERKLSTVSTDILRSAVNYLYFGEVLKNKNSFWDKLNYSIRAYYSGYLHIQKTTTTNCQQLSEYLNNDRINPHNLPIQSYK